MKDIENKELLINDKVIYATKEGSLGKGNITKFYKNCYGDEECSVKDSYNICSHILGHRIYKLNEVRNELRTN